MKKYILSAFIIAAAFATNAEAQQKVNLNLGDKTVATVKLDEGDYISFGRPEGVPEQKDVEVMKTDAGKNYISYRVETKEEGKLYQHALLTKSYVELLHTQMSKGQPFDETNEAAMKELFQTLLLAGYGATGEGTQTYKVVNGEKDNSGLTQYVFAGQDYYLVTCGVTMGADNTPSLDNDMAWVKIHTTAPGESSEQLSAEYRGIDDSGNAFFDVNPGSGIKTLHMVIGKAKSIDEFVNVYGYDYLMSSMSTNFTRSQWLELSEKNEHSWGIDEEDDYSLYVLGVDEEGNWVKAQVLNQHIKPAADNDCPAVNIINYMSGDTDEDGVGEVAIQYEIKTKAESITKAKMIVMTENEWDDALNEYMATGNYDKPSDAWAVYMEQSAEATDVTDAVKELGNKLNYSRKFTADERGWYVAVLAVTDEYGTTVTRAAFNPFMDPTNGEWSILSRTFPAAKASNAKAKKGMPLTTGKLTLK